MLVTQTHLAHGKQNYFQTLSNIFWGANSPRSWEPLLYKRRGKFWGGGGRAAGHLWRREKIQTNSLAQFLVPSRMWAPQGRGLPYFVYCRTPTPHPLHPEQHLTPKRQSIHSCQLHSCQLDGLCRLDQHSPFKHTLGAFHEASPVLVKDALSPCIRKYH